MRHTKETIKAAWEKHIHLGGKPTIRAFSDSANIPVTTINRHTTKEEREAWVEEASILKAEIVEDATAYLRFEAKKELKEGMKSNWDGILKRHSSIANDLLDTLEARVKMVRENEVRLAKQVQEGQIIDKDEWDAYLPASLEKLVNVTLSIRKLQTQSTIDPLPMTAEVYEHGARAAAKEIKKLEQGENDQEQIEKKRISDNINKKMEEAKARQAGQGLKIVKGKEK